MTVTTTLNRKDFVGDASTTAFAFTFNYFATSDVAVYLDDVKQTEVTHYTVAPASGTSGTVTFVTAPGSGVLITIIRELPLTQGIDLPTAGKFPADTVEEGLDRAMVAISDISERIDRSIVQDVSSTITNLVFPAPGATKLFRWNAAGDAIELVTLAVGDTLDVLTTLGDIIRGGAAGAAERLGIGANDSFFQVKAAQAVWRTLAQAKTDLGLPAGLASIQVFTTSGTWTKPAGIKTVLVFVTSGGGGGGGVDSNGSNDTSAGGGGGGSTGLKLLDVSSIATSTITIGAKGDGGSNTGGNGTNGGDSIWADGTNTINAGADLNAGQGATGASVSTIGVGGLAASFDVTGADVGFAGQGGGNGEMADISYEEQGGGTGGGSFWGGGQHGGVRNSAPGTTSGVFASAFGGGGGGGTDLRSTAGAIGGDGTPGIVVVLEFK